MKSKFDHPQTKITHPYLDYKTTVDRALAPLIRKLWKMGFMTSCSCQDADGKGFGYIALANKKSPRFAVDKALAISLASTLSDFVDVWLDIGPKDAMLRFRTKDIGKLIRILV